MSEHENDGKPQDLVKQFFTWLGDIVNLAALIAVIIVLVQLFNSRPDRLALLAAFGALILFVLLRYADVKRIRSDISKQNEAPPLGIAKGSVRALLALGTLAGFGLYVYYATRVQGAFKTEIFTAISSIMSAVFGFYFGSRSTAPSETGEKPAPLTVTGIDPNSGQAGEKVVIKNLAGSGFLEDATVALVRGDNVILADEVNVVQSTKITGIFNLPGDADPGAWDIVVTNPNNQKGTLPGQFTISQ